MSGLVHELCKTSEDVKELLGIFEDGIGICKCFKEVPLIPEIATPCIGATTRRDTNTFAEVLNCSLRNGSRSLNSTILTALPGWRADHGHFFFHIYANRLRSFHK